MVEMTVEITIISGPLREIPFRAYHLPGGRGVVKSDVKNLSKGARGARRRLGLRLGNWYCVPDVGDNP